MDRFRNAAGKQTSGSGVSLIRLLVGCDADGAFGMVFPIIMVVKGFYQSGKQQEEYEKE